MSYPMQDAIGQTVQNKQQAILFLNRRGNSRALVCVDCRNAPECPRCNANLTYHSANERLMCHHCGYSQPAVSRCPNCGGAMKQVGTGTQKIQQELEKDYALVVLDYNLNNKFEELEKITDKGRCEILVNALCAPGCPARSAHYRCVSANQKILAKSIREKNNQSVPLHPWNYEGCKGGRVVYAITNSSAYISPEAIWEKYVPMGFSNFKIEGRNDNIFNVIELYCMYMVKPEYQGMVRFIMLEKMEKLRLIQINMP